MRQSPAFLKQSWLRVKLPRQSVGPQVWEVKAAQVWQVQDKKWSDRTYWLIWARNHQTGEEKYFLSNAKADAKLQTLVRVAFRRWNVEHTFRVAKGEIGFTHYEGRNYTALMRHQTLCLLMLTFVAEHTQRLRGKNPEVTMEQVCSALNLLSLEWQENRRGTTRRQHKRATIAHHQRRNRVARESHQKRRQRRRRHDASPKSEKCQRSSNRPP